LVVAGIRIGDSGKKGSGGRESNSELHLGPLKHNLQSIGETFGQAVRQPKMAREAGSGSAHGVGLT
jgi:hypothetical protein